MWFLIIGGLLIASVAASPSWNYDDTDDWCPDYPTCCRNSTRQSPINIDERSATKRDMPALNYRFDGDGQIIGTVKNNGHTIQFDLKADRPTPIIEGGPLGSDRYELIQFHLHWGNSKRHGSEHRLNWKAFPAELHLVHKNTKYSDASAALAAPDGLAVMGLFMDFKMCRSEFLKPIVDVIRDLRTPGSEKPDLMIDLASLFTNVYGQPRYATYLGSLTTPGCNEAVTWIVFLDPFPIGRRDRNALASVFDNDRVLMRNNFRGLQCNDEPIYIDL